MKKIFASGIFVILMLITLSFASAVNSENDIEKRESPLYKIRTKQATGDRIVQIIDTIKTKFLGKRIFYLPFKEFLDVVFVERLASLLQPTCPTLPCTYECSIKPQNCVC